MTTGFTPGPWVAKDASIRATWDTGETVQVALLTTTHWSYPDKESCNKRMRAETEANARLIAAAPDLLAALDDLLHVIRTMGTCPTPDDDHCPHAEAIRRANAAIFAAKGDVEA